MVARTESGKRKGYLNRDDLMQKQSVIQVQV
ncbi:hypothetical protein BH18THE2_BH18THE2_43620 [soil metagenome]